MLDGFLLGPNREKGTGASPVPGVAVRVVWLVFAAADGRVQAGQGWGVWVAGNAPN